MVVAREAYRTYDLSCQLNFNITTGYWLNTQQDVGLIQWYNSLIILFDLQQCFSWAISGNNVRC